MQYDHSSPRSCRSGATLVELLVVLLVLGLVLSVVSLSIPQVSERSRDTALTGLERSALAAGLTQSALVGDSGVPLLATAYPDGYVLMDSLIGPGPLSRASR